MFGSSGVDSTKIHWETPKGNQPWGRTTVIDGTKEVPLTLDWLKKRFDLKIDPCANNREASMCDIFYTPEMDGLKQPWNQNTIFNPPFNQIPEFVARAVNQAIQHNVIVIGILPNYTDSDWFHDYCDILPKENLIWIRGRLNYWDPIEKRTGSPNFGQFLAIWSPHA